MIMEQLICDNPKCPIPNKQFWRTHYNSQSRKAKLHFCSDRCKYDYIRNVGYEKKPQNNSMFIKLMVYQKLIAYRKKGISFYKILNLTYSELCIIDVMPMSKQLYEKEFLIKSLERANHGYFIEPKHIYTH